MLLQSDPSDGGYGGGGFLGLFEALPPGMGASFESLRGRGGFIVSSSISKGTGVVGMTTITSARGTRCVMRRPQSWPKARIKVAEVGGSGAAVHITWTGVGAQEFLAFDTDVGNTYILSAQ
jgi:hypothetical protein